MYFKFSNKTQQGNESQVVDYNVKQIILSFLMKYQFHTPHLVETHMCNLLKNNLLQIWVCDFDLNLYA